MLIDLCLLYVYYFFRFWYIFFEILLNLGINELIYILVMIEVSSWSIEYIVVYFYIEIEMINFYRIY